MIKACAGLLIGLLVGAGSRWGGIPVPSPPTLVGALLLVAMTVGYAFTDAFLAEQGATTQRLCGGPIGPSLGVLQQHRVEAPEQPPAGNRYAG